MKEKKNQYSLATTLTSQPCLGMRKCRQDSLSTSFLDCGLYKQVVRKGHSADGIGDTRNPQTFVISRPKERDVHTQTSTVVLFTRGVNMGQYLSVSNDWEGGGRLQSTQGYKGSKEGVDEACPQAAAETSTPQGTVAAGSCGLEETPMLPA